MFKAIIVERLKLDFVAEEIKRNLPHHGIELFFGDLGVELEIFDEIPDFWNRNGV